MTANADISDLLDRATRRAKDLRDAADGFTYAYERPGDYDGTADVIGEMSLTIQRLQAERDAGLAACEWVRDAFLVMPALHGTRRANIRDVREEVLAALGQCMPGVRWVLDNLDQPRPDAHRHLNDAVTQAAIAAPAAHAVMVTRGPDAGPDA